MRVWPAVWGTVLGRMVLEDLGEKECDTDTHTNKTGKSHDLIQTENWRKILETNVPCASTIHYSKAHKKVNVFYDGHTNRF